MKKRNFIMAFACAAVLGVTAAPMTGLAEETETAEEELELLERPEYQASDYVKLGTYKGLTLTLEPIVVTEEEIDDQIRVNGGSDILEEITEGTVEEGDTANIDYEGKLDGEAFDGGTAKGFDLVIGSGRFIDGFEDGLIGVAIGDTVDLPLTFPEVYAEELAGKDVIFTVTVNSVKRMPEITGEIISQITGGEYTDVDTYRTSVRETLLAQKETSRESEIFSELLAQIASDSEITEYPQEMLDYGVENMKRSYQQMAKNYGMEFSDLLSTYMNMTEEQFEEQALLAVKQNLQAELYLKAIAEAEGIELGDSDYEESCQRYAQLYGYETAEELEAVYGEETIRISALQDKVLNFVKDNAEIEEIPETESESETEAGTEAEPQSEAGTEAESESEAESETETEA